MTVTRRLLLAAPAPFLLMARSGFAAEENQQIALDWPDEYILAASPEEALRRNSSHPPYVREKFEAPKYPLVAQEYRSEACVRLSLTISKTGAVQDPRVDYSYVKHSPTQHYHYETQQFDYPTPLFDLAAIKAIKLAPFAPAQVNGEPRDTHGFRYVFAFATVPAGTLTPDIEGTINNAKAALQQERWDDAESAIAQLRGLREKGGLNLTELARFGHLAAVLSWHWEHWAESGEYLQTTLSLLRFLDRDGGEVPEVWHLRLKLLIKLGKFDQAVDYYDAFKRGNPPLPVDDLADAVEALRGRGYGKGVIYFPLAYKFS